MKEPSQDDRDDELGNGGAELDAKIEELRIKLNALAGNLASFHDRQEILEVSRQLDRLILLRMKQKTDLRRS